MKNRRRTIRIKAKFQDRLVWETILFIFIFINILIMASFFFMKSVEDISVLKFNFAISLVVGELCGLAMVYYFSLKASHRIAGPIFSLERHLTNLGNGDLTVCLRLRKDDHLQDTADLFNETVTKLRERVTDMKQTVEMLRQRDELDSRTTALVESLEQQLSVFKTEAGIAHAETNDVEMSGITELNDRQALPETASNV